MQIIHRKGSFDSGHRVMNEKFKCFQLHGHTYLYTLNFSFEESESIGYALDFKEIKRTYMQWIDDILDHGMILNPCDEKPIALVREMGSKLWLMSLNGEGVYCNPSVENIAKEVYLAMEILTLSYPLLKLHSVEINETPNCGTICTESSIKEEERKNFRTARESAILEYMKNKGVLVYDDRVDSSKAFNIEN